MKILYNKYTGNKYQGEFFNINLKSKKILIPKKPFNINDYITKYHILIKSEVQNKKANIEQIIAAPHIILLKK